MKVHIIALFDEKMQTVPIGDPTTDNTIEPFTKFPVEKPTPGNAAIEQG
jgi:hypothetical protein